MHLARQARAEATVGFALLVKQILSRKPLVRVPESQATRCEVPRCACIYKKKKSPGDIPRLVLGIGIKSRSGSRSIRGEARLT